MVAVTVVTPLDLSRRADGLTTRLLALAEAISSAGWQLVVGHADNNSVHDRWLAAEFEGKAGVELASMKVRRGMANLARLRNIAVERAANSILLFLDADIHPDVALFRTLAEQASAGLPLAMAPCVYLSDAGTQFLCDGGKLEDIVESALSFEPKYVMHWAMPSSVMALSTEDYRAIGGFDEQYEGHGYEDLDFMLRFALAKGMVEESADLLVDRTYRAPLLSEGFRSALSPICMDNLLKGNVALHLFHGKDKEEPYHQRRADNASVFQEHFSYLNDCPGPSVGTPQLVAEFYSACERLGKNPSDFFALFDARPRNMLKRKLL